MRANRKADLGCKSNLSRQIRKSIIGVGMEDSNHLQRRLKARHLTMIAIGGAIGTGLFLASGGAVAQAGPGGALVAYAIMSLMVYFLMTSLGEMAAYMPVSGSFETYATKFVEPALGFSLGWNYWLNWAVTIAAELVAAEIIMTFWFPHVPGIIWSAMFFVILLALNLLSVRAFGEGEFWFSSIKVATVLIFLVSGVLMIFGIIGGKALEFHNWTVGDAPFVGGFEGILLVLMIAGYSFQGTELVGIAAGESDNPRKNIPRAVNTIFWRITIFYIGGIAVIGTIIPYMDKNLLNSSDVAVSPFTLLFEHSGFPMAAAIMNAVILTAVLSAGNSGMYASTRMLFALAKEGKAPKIFCKVSKGGIPVPALLFTAMFGMLSFFTSLFGEGAIYAWIVNLSGLLGFIAWLGIAISHLRFRRAFKAQGKDLSVLPYRAKMFPFGPILAMILCLFVIGGQNYKAFMGSSIDWLGVIGTYASIPLFFVLYFGYKIKMKSKIIALKDIDLTTFDHY